MAQLRKGMATSRGSDAVISLQMASNFSFLGILMDLLVTPLLSNADLSNFSLCTLETQPHQATLHTRTALELPVSISPLSPVCLFHGKTPRFC